MAASNDSTTHTRGGWGLSRYSLAGALAGCAVLALIAVLVIGVGGGGSAESKPPPGCRQGAVLAARNKRACGHRGGPSGGGLRVPVLEPTEVEFHSGSSSHSAGVSVEPGRSGRGERGAGPRSLQEFPAPASVHHKAADTPSKAAEVAVAPGAPSDAEVRRELNQMHAVERQARKQTLTTVPGGGSIGGNGTITPPPGIPAVIARVIAGGNAITDFPYVFGGGHASFVDNAYDCSGSVSYALAAGGLLSSPETSGTLWRAGAPQARGSGSRCMPMQGTLTCT